MSDFLLIIFLIVAIVGPLGLILFFNFRKRDIDDTQSDKIRDLERRLTDLMTAQLKEIRGSVDGTSKAMNQQIFSFTKETVQIREDMRQVQEVMKNISSFQEIFRSPKLRGEWGEESLEHILGEYFPKELYEPQHLFSSGKQVDVALKLPNNKILPIDAKFSYDNYKKMVEAENEEEKKLFRKKFIEDTKARIQEISSEYIYFWIKNEIGDIISHQTGGAQQHINKNNLDSYDLLIPDDKTLQDFNKIIQPIFKQISINCFQNQTLSSLRDTLLPKLMSGEVRVR